MENGEPIAWAFLMNVSYFHNSTTLLFVIVQL